MLAPGHSENNGHEFDIRLSSIPDFGLNGPNSISEFRRRVSIDDLTLVISRVNGKGMLRSY